MQSNTSVKLYTVQDQGNGFCSVNFDGKCTNLEIDMSQINLKPNQTQVYGLQNKNANVTLSNEKYRVPNETVVSLVQSDESIRVRVCKNLSFVTIHKHKNSLFDFCERGHKCSQHHRLQSCSLCESKEKESDYFYCFECRLWICNDCMHAMKMNEQMRKDTLSGNNYNGKGHALEVIERVE